ncbi:hypothetical protein NL676_036874 [Syzygium grande]|nr:hypothetical protein NL676_036874 [Syzygium grande]
MVVDPDPISKALAAKHEEESDSRFAKLEEKLYLIYGYEPQSMVGVLHITNMKFPENSKSMNLPCMTELEIPCAFEVLSNEDELICGERPPLGRLTHTRHFCTGI